MTEHCDLAGWLSKSTSDKHANLGDAQSEIKNSIYVYINEIILYNFTAAAAMISAIAVSCS